MTIKLGQYIIRLRTSWFKDPNPSEYIITPYISFYTYSSEYYYEKTVSIDFHWLYWTFSVYGYINK